jgi:hypothetical protein
MEQLISQNWDCHLAKVLPAEQSLIFVKDTFINNQRPTWSVIN